jgi:hypothetical protein
MTAQAEKNAPGLVSGRLAAEAVPQDALNVMMVRVSWMPAMVCTCVATLWAFVLGYAFFGAMPTACVFVDSAIVAGSGLSVIGASDSAASGASAHHRDRGAAGWDIGGFSFDRDIIY